MTDDQGGPPEDANPDAGAPDGVQNTDPASDADSGGDDANALAEQALAAAREAISSLNSGDDGSEPAAQSEDDEAEAIAAAALAAAGVDDTPSAAASFVPPSLDAGALGDKAQVIELLDDVNLNVTIELGRTRMLIEDVLRLSDGAVVELDKLAGDPVDVYVNDRHIARGEVLVLNENFCVRISEIIDQDAPRATAG